MTRSALKKIGIFAGLLTLCIGCCIWVDSSFAIDSSSNQGNESNHLETTGGATSIIKMIEEDDPHINELARACFDLPLETDIPSAFIDEVLDPRDFDAAYISGTTLSFIHDGSLEEAQAFCENSLEKKGWVALPQKNQIIDSFIKTTGAYHSLVVQYLSMDDKTVIMIDPST
jgi:hypothetical protein